MSDLKPDQGFPPMPHKERFHHLWRANVGEKGARAYVSDYDGGFLFAVSQDWIDQVVDYHNRAFYGPTWKADSQNERSRYVGGE